MNSYLPRRVGGNWEGHLLGLNGLVITGSLLFIWRDPEPESTTIPEVIIPLGISLGLTLYTVRLKRQNITTVHSETMVKYVWTGALLSGVAGGVWLALHLYYDLPIDLLPDKILTVLSVGIASGVLIGHSPAIDQRPVTEPERPRVIAEASWVDRSGSSPVLEAIIEGLAEAEEVDTRELTPLYDQLDPEILARLRSQANTPWQLLFDAEEYQIRVSSHGTVTIYRTDG